jgi:hypothetical protein
MTTINANGSFTVNNEKDTGSLLVGELIDHITVGQVITVNGRQYTVSYLMRSKSIEKNRVCAKGCGPFPVGPCELFLGEVQTKATPKVESLSRAQLLEMLKALEAEEATLSAQ